MDISILQRSLDAMVSSIAGASLSSALMTLQPPEFSGGPHDDIYEWLEQFDKVTFALPDDQKLKLLSRSFIKAAKPWFHEEIKPKLDEKSWAEIKIDILDRFSGQKKEDRYYERLLNLKYDPQRHGSTLLFIDEYAHVYKKAHPSAQGSEIVRATVLNLPANIRRKFNLIADIQQVATITELKIIARRYDNECETTQEHKSPPLDLDKFKQIMTDVVSDLAEKQSEKTQEILAAFMKAPNRSGPASAGRGRPSYKQYYQGEGYPPHQQQVNYYGNDGRQDWQQHYAAPINNLSGHIQYQPGYPAISQDVRSDYTNFYKSDSNNRQPRRPCRHCGGEHWNRDCPTIERQHLNYQGRVQGAEVSHPPSTKFPASHQAPHMT